MSLCTPQLSDCGQQTRNELLSELSQKATEAKLALHLASS